MPQKLMLIVQTANSRFEVNLVFIDKVSTHAYNARNYFWGATSSVKIYAKYSILAGAEKILHLLTEATSLMISIYDSTG